MLGGEKNVVLEIIFSKNLMISSFESFLQNVDSDSEIFSIVLLPYTAEG